MPQVDARRTWSAERGATCHRRALLSRLPPSSTSADQPYDFVCLYLEAKFYHTFIAAVAPHNFITFLLVCSQKRLLLFVVVFVDVAVVVAVVVSSSRTLGHFD